MKYKYQLTTNTTEEDRFLTVVRIGKSKENEQDARLECQFSKGIVVFEICFPKWEIGFDFFSTFESACVKYVKSHYFQPDQEDIDIEKKLIQTYIHISQKLEKWKAIKFPEDKVIKPVPTILCNICKHRINYNTCRAFPDSPGIPKPWKHTDLHLTLYPKPKQFTEYTFELGEAGSRGAKIKPIKSLQILSSRFTTAHDLELFKQIREGLLEEEYSDDPLTSVNVDEKTE